MELRWTHEGPELHTNSTRKWTFGKSSGDFWTTPDVAAEPWEITPMNTRWLRISTRMSRWVPDHSRIWRFPISCVHRQSKSGLCDTSIRDTSTLPTFWLVHLFTHLSTRSITHSLTHLLTPCEHYTNKFVLLFFFFFLFSGCPYKSPNQDYFCTKTKYANRLPKF